MKKIALKLLVFGVAISMTSCGLMKGSKGTELRLNMEKGETVQFETKMTMNFFNDAGLTDQMMAMDFTIYNDYEIMDKDAEGNHTVKYKVSRVIMNQNVSGMDMSYDSDNPDAGGPMGAAIGDQLGDLINNPITLKVNNLGRVTEMPETEVPGQLSFDQLTKGLFFQLPQEEITVGKTWTEEMNSEGASSTGLTFNSIHTVEEINGSEVVIKTVVDKESVDLDVEGAEGTELDLEQSGKNIIDKKTGRIVSSTTSQTMQMQSPQGEMFIVNVINVTSK